ncbi:MAG TPA: M56 family metallopeptidase [Fimbriimonadaceae bacterium]|nr:M56 family metallopeptidase [Fimbriimonadaceae bacterium]HRJ97500.1 M56 family metallopeptidase [Fimbriimonadaceae bacterium]
MPNLPNEVIDFFATWAALAAVVITSAWLLARTRWSPPRMRIGLLAVAAIVVLAPLSRSLWPARPVLAIDASTQASLAETPSRDLAPVVPGSAAQPITPRNSNLERSSMPAAEVLLVFWWIGAAFAWARLLRSVVLMNRLRRSAERREGVLRSPRVTSPVAAGFPIAEVIVPEYWPKPFAPEEAAAALQHERAHVKGGHVAIRVLAEIVAGWFWWLPTGWLSIRLLEEALEDLADQHTFEKRIALAHALVRLSEARLENPRLCTGIASSPAHLERRIRNLLENRPMKTHQKPLAVLVVTLFALGGVIAGVGLFGEPAENGAYGLVPGATWTYETTAENGEKSTITTVALRAIPFSGRSVIELTSKSDRHTSYSYVSADSKGYWSYHNARMQGPGFARTETPEPVWKLPLTKGVTWTYRQPFRGQIMVGEGGEPNMEDLAFDCSAKVMATDESVEVPAGTFRAAHVRIDRVSKANGTNSTDLWIAEGVGVVRSVDRYPSGTWERRLTSFTPGKGVKLVVPAGYTRVVQEPVVDYLHDAYACGPLERGRRKILRLGAKNHVFDAMDKGSVSDAAFQGLGERGDVSDRLTALAVLAALQNGANPADLLIVSSSFTVDSDGARRFIAVIEDGMRQSKVRYSLSKTAVTSVQIEIGR